MPESTCSNTMHQLLLLTAFLVVIFTATITIGLGEKFLLLQKVYTAVQEAVKQANLSYVASLSGRRNILGKHTCLLSYSSVDIRYRYRPLLETGYWLYVCLWTKSIFLFLSLLYQEKSRRLLKLTTST